MRVALDDECFESGEGQGFLFYFIEGEVFAEIGRGKGFPKSDGGGFLHVESFADEVFVAEFATQVNHAHIEKGIAVAEIT